MSADIIPMPAPKEATAPVVNISPLAAPAQAAEPDALSRLLKNPFILAGGAMLAGMALTRLFATPSVQKLARTLADEALKQARQSTTGQAASPAAPSLLDEAIESVRPQITDAARQFLTRILRKP